MAQLIQAPGQEELGGNAWQELCAVRRLQWEKFLKAKLEDAVELFNDDYRKGFQMMQARPPSLLRSSTGGECWTACPGPCYSPITGLLLCPMSARRVIWLQTRKRTAGTDLVQRCRFYVAAIRIFSLVP